VRGLAKECRRLRDPGSLLLVSQQAMLTADAYSNVLPGDAMVAISAGSTLRFLARPSSVLLNAIGA
jgi:hypothetical protein